MKSKRLASYKNLFRAAFPGRDPFDYQTRLAESKQLPALVHVPTGGGKTAAVIGAWLWRRLREPHSTGRRLVYCLPMRTLVEQTRGVAEQALKSLDLTDRFKVHTIMGGDADGEWDTHPERECIIVGTQDMLLSRALNRGYAMSRFRWPIQFGLLNNDCLWIFDEIQLMGDGLGTTTQLAAFRDKLGTFGECRSIWMSATLDREWLRTIDFGSHVDGLTELTLSERDLAAPALSTRLNALKTVQRAPRLCRTPRGLAAFVRDNHTKGTQTLIVVNSVARARETFAALEDMYGLTSQESGRGTSGATPRSDTPNLLLIHSRFRPRERGRLAALINDPPGPNGGGRIIVSTQVIEAGVDISSKLLVTDIAPYASLVQRFGRCNRAGEFDDAQIFWVDRPLREKDARLAEKEDLDEKEHSRIAAPYDWHDLETARGILATITSGAPADLPGHRDRHTPAHVLRRRDLIDLFDTTPDLSGYDLDISRFVRGGEERDVSVAWRDLKGERPQREAPRLTRDELCPVPIGDELLSFLKVKDTAGKPRQAWTWNTLDRDWQKVTERELRAGMTLLLDSRAGGYDRRRGWDASSKPPVEDISDVLGEKNEGYADDPLTFNPAADQRKQYFQTLSAHSREARAAAVQLADSLAALGLGEWRDDLVLATHHHDWGKCHHIFQETLHKNLTNVEPGVMLAKSTGGGAHSRPHFRHELASALALLQCGSSDLAIYLAACHHGKVRLSIRALPGEMKPGEPERQYARGIWDGEKLPAIDLGDGERCEEFDLSLAPMLLGAAENGGRSWLERMIALRDRLGVFRLAFLESLIRAADVRASANPQDYWTEEGA